MARFEFYDLPPDIREKMASLRLKLAGDLLLLKLLEFAGLVRKKFNPKQPRVPAGSSDGGQWTSGGGGGATSGDGASVGDNIADTGDGNTPARIVLAAFPAGGSLSGVPAKLPNGVTVPDATSATGQMMSPISDLSDVASAGRNLGETYNRLLQNPETAPTAFNYFAGNLLANVGTGGTFDYQRGDGNLITGYTQLRQFRNVSNFNVGLFSQQAGLTLNETLSLAGFYAARFSGNADPSQPYGLSSQTYQYIVAGHKVGQSGIYGPAASLTP